MPDNDLTEKNPEDIDNSADSATVGSSPKQQEAVHGDGGAGDSADDAHTKAQTQFLATLRRIVIGAAIGVGLYCLVVTGGIFWLTFADIGETLAGKDGRSAAAWLEYMRYFAIAAFSSITVIVSSVFLGIRGMLAFLVKQGTRNSSGGN